MRDARSSSPVNTVARPSLSKSAGVAVARLKMAPSGASVPANATSPPTVETGSSKGRTTLRSTQASGSANVRVPGIKGSSARAAADGIRAVLAGEAEFSLEYPCHSPVEKRWFQLRASRLEHCGAVFAVVAHHNITKRILAEQERQALLVKAQQTAERQQLLIRELHHRVRNTLATVQGLLGATARSTISVDEFYRSFAGRIASLGEMHTLLTEDYWQTASLEEMLRNELDRYDQGTGQGVFFEGPPLELSADLAVPMGMALHELTANAAKHGALSVRAGQIQVLWDVVHEGGRRKLDLEWTERGGPPVR